MRIISLAFTKVKASFKMLNIKYKSHLLFSVFIAFEHSEALEVETYKIQKHKYIKGTILDQMLCA